MGSRAQIADKLVSAFTHGAAGQVYRVIALETISILVGILRALDEPVTIRRLRRELDRTRMPGLAHRARDLTPELADDLAELSRRGGVSADAFEGMRARLGALLHGEYGGIFDSDGPQLDLPTALASPGVTYISLPALAVSQDTALMARVLIQDLKQAAFLRLQQPDAAPAMLVLDEFAALDDPEQINDLLRQAREARLGAVVSTQQLPDPRTAHALRGALLGAGLLIAHRVGHDDAEAVARVIGTERVVLSICPGQLPREADSQAAVWTYSRRVGHTQPGHHRCDLRTGGRGHRGPAGERVAGETDQECRGCRRERDQGGRSPDRNTSEAGKGGRGTADGVSGPSKRVAAIGGGGAAHPGAGVAAATRVHPGEQHERPLACEHRSRPRVPNCGRLSRPGVHGAQ